MTINSSLRVITNKIKTVASDIVTVRTGTVVSNYAAMSSTVVTLDNDPDQTQVQALALGGPLPSGTRVMMIAYPPRGLAIVGTMTSLDTGWVEVLGGIGFQNSWVNFGGGFTTAQYRKIGTEVFVRGLVKSGSISGAAIFTLPAGYRPLASLMFAEAAASLGVSGGVTGPASAGTAHTHTPGTLTSSSAGVRIDVASTGVIAVADSNVGNGFVSLSGISFFTD